MASDGKNSGNGKTSPFGNGRGDVGETQGDKPTDFATNANTSQNKGGGGFDVTKQNRPQSEAKQEVKPNPQEIPAGGAVLKADPKPVGQTISGDAKPIGSVPRPFKGLK